MELCDICQTREATDWDHDYETDLLRGRLCRRCNMGVGFVETSNIDAILNYLASPPRQDGTTYSSYQESKRNTYPSRTPERRAAEARRRFAEGYRSPGRN